VTNSTWNEVNPAWSWVDPPAFVDATPTATPTATNTALPNPTPTPPGGVVPSWPVTEVTSALRDLLLFYYNQEAPASGSLAGLAPKKVDQLRTAHKDPDTLWEAVSRSIDPDSSAKDPSCHAGASWGKFVDCTGARLAMSLNLPYHGGSTLLREPYDFYRQGLLVVETAGAYVLYHAFAHEYDAPYYWSYEPTLGRAPRDYKAYHRSLIAAYEAHMRDTIGRMFRDTRKDTKENREFQHSLTRSAGVLSISYARTIQVLDELDAWTSDAARHEAMSVLNALNQRIWWEWVAPQTLGPRTAGFADLGSRKNYEDISRAHPSEIGKHEFFFDGEMVESLRPANFDTGKHEGLTFDADYGVPGEGFCYATYSSPADRQACIEHARKESLGGIYSPFGEYFGDGDCGTRAARRTDKPCGQPNSGSIAEEWMWTYVGARSGMAIVKGLAERGDAALPFGAVGLTEYATVTDRLGYGVSGWHGGEGRNDDMEWVFSTTWPFEYDGEFKKAIRTLSAARNDAETQNGRYSLGETDIAPGISSAKKGDTWAEDRQEYPGAIENKHPGPSPNYGAYLFSLVMSDKPEQGLSPSLYGASRHRNHPDEFATWAWLLQSTFYRCDGVSDPVDPICFAFEPSNRRALFTAPEDGSVPMSVRYLFRDPAGQLDSQAVASGSGLRVPDLCRTRKGLPWSSVSNGSENWIPSGYLVDENGWGAYNALLQGMGGFMRLAAERYGLAAPEPDLRDAYERQRDDVLKPWYNEARWQVLSVIGLYRDPVAGYGYMPDAENAICNEGDQMYTWYQVAAESDYLVAARRARWYSTAALWYWWYASDWMAPSSPSR